MSDTESDIEDIPHDEAVKRQVNQLQVPENEDSPTSSGEGRIDVLYFHCLSWYVLVFYK